MRRKAKYNQHLEEYQRYLDTPRNEDQMLNPASPDQSPPRPSRLMKLKKSMIITTPPSQSNSFPSSSPQNDLLQISPSQSSLPQNIPPQISLSQNTPILSPTPHSNSGVSVVPSPVITRLSLEDLETIRAMMIEGMQAKNTKTVDKEETVEILDVEGVEERTQPFSFLTLSTVEGIVGSTRPADLAEQSTWDSKVEKFMRLSDTYSTRHTISGELCYMVDQELYKDILLCLQLRLGSRTRRSMRLQLSSWTGTWGRLRAVVCE